MYETLHDDCEIFWVWVEHDAQRRADVCMCVCMYVCGCDGVCELVCVCVYVCVYCAYLYIFCVWVEDNAQRRAEDLHPLLREVRCAGGTKLYYSEWTGHFATAATMHSDTLCGSYISISISICYIYTPTHPHPHTHTRTHTHTHTHTRTHAHSRHDAL